MPTLRKAHRKSRKGCAQCKRRHNKCDEVRPVCGACCRLGTSCSYSRPVPIHGISTLPQVLGSTQPSPENSWSLSDMALLHHYSTCNCLQFATHSARHRCWAYDVPRFAFGHPYLLHQILAVAALHCSILGPEHHHLADSAVSHRAQALENVQPVLSKHDSSDSIPIFAFAGLTAIYAFGEIGLQLKKSTTGHDAIESLLTCFKLTRGITAVVETHRDFIQNSPVKEMIDLDANDKRRGLRSIGLRFDQAQILEEVIKAKARTTEDIDAFTHAANQCMESIQLLLETHDDDDEIYHLIMVWPNDISQTFIRALECWDSLALLVLAHFTVLMSLRPKLWWLLHWPNLVFRQIMSILGDEWEYYLQWPKMMLEKPRNARMWSEA